jgi:uncharacterized protein YggT (Ycf19 family)
MNVTDPKPSRMRVTALNAARILLWLVYVWVAITLVLLLLMFILELFGANPSAGFVDWVYRSTQRAMAPFRGIFEPIVLSDKSVLDVSVLFAMIVYGFVALGLHLAIDWVSGKFHAEQRRQQQLELAAMRTSSGGPSQVVQLVGPAGVTARAVFTPYPGGTSIQVTAAGLDPSHSYSIWLAGSEGVRVSAATFQPKTTGVTELSLTTPVAVADSQTFGLSRLPKPGELSPIDVLTTNLA